MTPFAFESGDTQTHGGSRADRTLSAAAIPIWVISILLAALTATMAPLHADRRYAGDGPVFVTDIKGAIGFVTANELTKAIDIATRQNASALVVQLDTPGGLVASTREMTQAILGSSVPVVMYVAPSGARAASAGTYLVYAAHIAAMAPGTHLGAATPIPLGGPGLPGSPEPKKPAEKPGEAEPTDAAGRKSVNDAVAYIRTLAELRNRNADWAEKAVREAATLTATQALKEHVVDVIAKNVGDLLTAIDGRQVTTAAGEVRLNTEGRKIVEIRHDWKMRVMQVITDPNIAFILFLIGVYGILFEFWSPGAVAPGVIGGISLIVALTALSVLPVNYGGLALILFGIGLMVAEAHAPTFGLLGLGGIAAFVLGALFLFEPGDTDIPVAVAWPIIGGAAAASAAFFIGILGFAVRARTRPVRTGAEQMLGSTGEVLSWSRDEGHVRAHGEVWSARSTQDLRAGDKVRITGRTGLTLLVERMPANGTDICRRAKP